MPYQITAKQLEEVWRMPALSHYPDRAKKFDFADSLVIQFLERTLEVNLIDACRAFEKLRRHKDILYHPVDKVWMGKTLFQEEIDEERQTTQRAIKRSIEQQANGAEGES
jgi:hypothetical protein